MRDFLVKRPMLLSAIFSSIALLVGVNFEELWLAICILAFAFLVLSFLGNKKSTIVFSFFMIVAVMFCAHFHILQAKQIDSYSNTVCSGEYIVIDGPYNHGDYYSATVETVKSEMLKKGSKITVTYSVGNLNFAQNFKADIQLKSLNDSKYKYENYSESIYIKGSMYNVISLDKYDFVLKSVGRLRDYIKNKILHNFEIREAAIIMALLTGDKSYFTNEFYENVKASGVAHVMVVSGMHLSVIVSLFLFVCDKFFYNRFLKAFIIFLTVLIVSAVCGFTMSIIRAGVTYILIAVSLIINRQNTPANTLGAAVTLIMFCNPFAIFSLSFQLSVLSTFGILVVAIPVTEYVSKRKIIKSKILLGLFSSVAISISALLLTAPLTIYIFGYISNVSVITNLLISNVVTWAIILCILGLCLPFLSKIFFVLSGFLVTYINFIINYFGSLPFAVTRLHQFVSCIAVLIVVIVFWVLLACKKHNDMIKLKEIDNKRIKEGGKKIKWQSQMKKS